MQLSLGFLQVITEYVYDLLEKEGGLHRHYLPVSSMLRS